MGQAQHKKKKDELVPQNNKKKKNKGFGDLLIGQILAVLLIWFSVTFNESSKTVTMVGTAVLLIGVLFFCGRGLKALWMKNKQQKD